MKNKNQQPKHTPEPWRISDLQKHVITSDALENLAGCCGDFFKTDVLEGEKDLANAERIVACVNACAGIPTQTLLRPEVKQYAFFTWLEMENQRDELAELATKLMQSLATYGSHPILEKHYKVVMDKIKPPMDAEFWQNEWNCKPYSGVKSGEKNFKTYRVTDHNLTNEGGGHE